MFVIFASHTLSSCVIQMDPLSYFYIGYDDGETHYMWNLVSTSWAIFTPLHTLVDYSGICVGFVTNNQAKYDVVIGLLVNALMYHVYHRRSCLNS
jgi:hypothetical protein